MPTQFRTNRLLFLLSLLALALFWAATSAEAAPAQQTTQSATCALYIDGALDPHSSTDPLTCAQTVATSAPAIDGYAFGRWGGAYLAVNADGDTYVRQNRRWQFWQTITVDDPLAGDVPVAVEGDQDGDGIADEVDGCLDSAENYNGVLDSDGCPDTLLDLLSFIADDLNAYWQAEFDEANIRYRPVTNISSYTSPGRRSGAYNAYYSSYGHRIAFDTRLMNDSLNNLGDAAPVFILAHEFGHAVQAQLGRLGDRHTIYSELEADCLAGAYFANVNERGLLDEGDTDEAKRQAYNVGDFLPADHHGAHGSPSQRANAFELGLTEGPDTCLQSFNP